MKLPEFDFNNESLQFDVESYVAELQLPPLSKDPTNRTIPFEEILANQCKRSAKENSFRTNKHRLIFWLKALQLRYCKQLRNDPKYHVDSTDRRKMDPKIKEMKSSSNSIQLIK